MLDKIQKIKEEIERRIDLYSIAEKDDSTFARMGELSSLMDFIDSIPEETTVKGITWEDVNTLESLIYQVHNEYPSIGEKSLGLEVLERFQGCQDDIEEPASEALEEEINYIGKNEYFDFSDWKSIARHFAEWQKQKDLQDFLEKAEKILTERMYFSDDEAKEFKNYMKKEA